MNSSHFPLSFGMVKLQYFCSGSRISQLNGISLPLTTFGPSLNDAQFSFGLKTFNFNFCLLTFLSSSMRFISILICSSFLMSQLNNRNSSFSNFKYFGNSEVISTYNTHSLSFGRFFLITASLVMVKSISLILLDF
jgi:hypothetical protein